MAPTNVASFPVPNGTEYLFVPLLGKCVLTICGVPATCWVLRTHG